MNPAPRQTTQALLIRKVRRKAQAFGISALEVMLVITFLVLLMLMAYFSIVQAEVSKADQAFEGIGEDELPDNPNELKDTIFDLQRQLQTALAEKRRSEDEIQSLRNESDADAERIDELEETSNDLARENSRLSNELEELERLGEETDPDLGPPIIRLSEADGYLFETNSSAIRPEFAERLRSDAVPAILRIAYKYRTDTIDIVGHTDERPIAGMSNLDDGLLPFLNGDPTPPLTAADNAGLGFARAAAVARVLSEIPDLWPYKIVPMSGAQVILLDGEVSSGMNPGDVPARRRIEVRVRRSDSPN